MNKVNISKPSIEDLKVMREQLNEEISDLEREAKQKMRKTREEVTREFDHFGYIVPPTAKFWKIHGPNKGLGAYGMEVGSYTHSCHIDTTDLKVLLVVDGNEHYVESYADLWLSDPV
jgi:hypothetical protein